MIRILLVGGGSEVGGAARYARNLVDNLSKRSDVEFEFMDLKGAYERRGKIRKAIELICKLPKRIEYKRFDLIHYLEFNLSLYGVVKYVRIKNSRVRIIKTCHGMRRMEKHYRGLMEKGPLRAFESIVQKYVQRNIDGVIYVSDGQRDSFVDAYALDKSKTYVVYLASGLKRYDGTVDSLIGNKETSIIFVGRIERRKRVEKFLELASLLPDRDFKVIGPVVDRGYYNQLLKSKPENARFLLDVSDDELVQHYRRARYFVSFSEWENCPLTYLESISQGTPVIGYSMPVKAMVDGGCGYEVRSASECVNRIGLLEKDYESTVRKALEASKQFSWDKVVQETVEVYNKYATMPWAGKSRMNRTKLEN